MALSQNERLIQIDTPLGKDACIATSLVAEETLSSLFSISMTIQSDDMSIKPKDLVGKSVSAAVYAQKGGKPRYFSGLVCNLRTGKASDKLRTYVLQVVPDIWLLTQTSHHRIFSNKSALDIIKEVITGVSGTGTINVSGVSASKYVKRQHCVQFGETDFQFISRLMEEEGIAYFFKHEQGKHTLMLADAANSYPACDDDTVPYIEQPGSNYNQVVNQWHTEFSLHSGSVQFADYCDQATTNDFAQQKKTSTQLPGISALEQHFFHQYPFIEGSEGQHNFDASQTKQAATREIERFEADHEIASGCSDCAAFFAGGQFTLQHPLDGDNRYLIRYVKHYASHEWNSTATYSNEVTAMPADVVFRPRKTTTKAVVSGPHTAKVVEIKGAAAGADKFTQVKVEFPWHTKHNSCLVRVAQSYAGNGWGAYFVPRKNQEVIVEFLGGDPDRPIITGAVYNSSNHAPPYTGTQSGLRTESKDFNELRFDDKEKSEEVYFQAGKDYNFLVKNDETGEIQNNQSLTVKQDRSITITDGNESKTLNSGNQTTSVKKGSISVDAKSSIDHSTKSTYSVDASGAIKITSKASIELKVGGSSIKITPTAITLKQGGSQIKLDPANVEAKATMVKAQAQAMAEVKASGMLTLKGGMTMIN